MKPSAAPVPLDVSVVTITYNERENIRVFLETVHGIFTKNNLPGEVIVVDDSSPDDTSEVVLELTKKYPHTRLIKRPGKLGIGSAYRDGVAAATGKVIMLLDADLSHPPEIIPQMYAASKEGNIAWGSRYLDETKFETDLPHRIGTFILNRWVNFWLGTNMKDHTNGYVALSKPVFDKIIEKGKEKNLHPFNHILYGITIAALAKDLGIANQEIKAPYHQRKFGETKIPFLWGLRVVFGDIWYTLQVRHRLQK
ncbi:TPA: glycosyltransferase family 2 protein [Candidatus Woesearchaeota archaeon]|nr:glycosyltransferase family 2 protein [Candidatus Woesearchaeota archaeon]HIH12357.1 glycosyltransferase family 2 protein [Candidatus Woesearchaeota archaeon]